MCEHRYRKYIRSNFNNLNTTETFPLLMSLMMGFLESRVHVLRLSQNVS